MEGVENTKSNQSGSFRKPSLQSPQPSQPYVSLNCSFKKFAKSSLTDNFRCVPYTCGPFDREPIRPRLCSTSRN